MHEIRFKGIENVFSGIENLSEQYQQENQCEDFDEEPENKDLIDKTEFNEDDEFQQI